MSFGAPGWTLDSQRVPSSLYLTEMNLGPQGADHRTSDEPAASPIFSDGYSDDEEEEEEPVIQASTSQPSTSGLASKVPVQLSFTEEELEEEGEIPLTRKQKVPYAKLPSNDSIEISQDVAEQGAEGDLPDLVPTAEVRLDKRRKLILPANESEDENNQVVPPIQVNKEMVDQGPSKVGGGQSLALATTTAAETSTPTSQTTCAIFSQGEISSRASAPSSSSAAQGITMPVVENSAVGRTILQVLKSTDEACKPIVAELEQLLTVLETPGFKVLQNLGMLFKIKSLLQQISEIKPFLASSGQFLVQWLDRILDKAAMVQKIPDQSLDPAVVVEQYRAKKAKQIDLYGKAEASLKELEAIEQEKQRVRAQIEADRLHRAKLILELQELERQTSASEPVIDALTSQAIALTLAETEANSLQKSINVEFENVKDLVSTALAFMK
ncbi:hypothetical protein Pyn_32375 [Prunus yedoensis var. nudiflora]|uniref:Uncharacterized protein n=1 Tax=Prunus yedoensis var. nudiflora TaxID=2094558 RepID=A0A314UCD8_PRUYE|nr:hypothetical protein Pyn_32375 [Prunus yedoensis var. nudiflora]